MYYCTSLANERLLGICTTDIGFVVHKLYHSL